MVEPLQALLEADFPVLFGKTIVKNDLGCPEFTKEELCKLAKYADFDIATGNSIEKSSKSQLFAFLLEHYREQNTRYLKEAVWTAAVQKILLPKLTSDWNRLIVKYGGDLDGLLQEVNLFQPWYQFLHACVFKQIQIQTTSATNSLPVDDQFVLNLLENEIQELQQTRLEQVQDHRYQSFYKNLINNVEDFPSKKMITHFLGAGVCHEVTEMAEFLEQKGIHIRFMEQPPSVAWGMKLVQSKVKSLQDLFDCHRNSNMNNRIETFVEHEKKSRAKRNAKFKVYKQKINAAWKMADPLIRSLWLPKEEDINLFKKYVGESKMVEFQNLVQEIRVIIQNEYPGCWQLFKRKGRQYSLRNASLFSVNLQKMKSVIQSRKNTADPVCTSVQKTGYNNK